MDSSLDQNGKPKITSDNSIYVLSYEGWLWYPNIISGLGWSGWIRLLPLKFLEVISTIVIVILENKIFSYIPVFEMIRDSIVVYFLALPTYFIITYCSYKFYVQWETYQATPTPIAELPICPICKRQYSTTTQNCRHCRVALVSVPLLTNSDNNMVDKL